MMNWKLSLIKSEEWSVMTIEYSVENKEVYHMEGQKSNKEKRGEKQHAEELEERQ